MATGLRHRKYGDHFYLHSWCVACVHPSPHTRYSHAFLDLTENATILYSSDSVVDILGYTPDDIVNRSAWEFFDLKELPVARDFHKKRVVSDKAAVLAYCRIKNSEGQWVGCECCFTIVYDVMVVCTSIYTRTPQSESKLPSLLHNDGGLTFHRARYRSATGAPHILFVAKGSEVPHVVSSVSEVLPAFQEPAT